jgi:DNA processing protein
MTEVRLGRLLGQFAEPEQILGAGRDDLLSIDGVDSELVDGIRSYKRSETVVDRIRAARECGIVTISQGEAAYPTSLAGLRGMPPVLFVRGELTEDDQLAIAVVGTRRPSFYGQAVAERLAREFAEHGVTVVSGMARGVDTCAHHAALAAGGRTVAVLGSGVDVCYPSENRRLSDEIAEHGAVISEFNLGTEPFAMNFPKRNRVVSGLSRGIVAVEAGERSGVLNTAAWAANQGRDVYAVPGRITDHSSAGTNRLLREGAKPVMGTEDVLQDLGVALHLEERAKVRLDGDEKPVLALLSGDPLHVDEVCQGTDMPMAKLLGILMQLELKGAVRQLPGKFFVRQF